MTLNRPRLTYDFEDVPVYGSLKVSSSSDWLNMPQAFDFAKAQGGRLQTIGEALVARVSFQEDVDKHPDIFDTDEKKEAGLDHSKEYQRTSTVSLKLKNDGSFNIDAPYIALFADLPADEKSRDLVQAGYDANVNDRELILPVKDAFICDLIARAKDTGRIAPAQTTRTLQLKLKKEKGKSEYGQHKTPIAIFGNVDLAELNASYLKAQGYDFGKVWDLTQKELEKMIKKDEALVRAVGLGDVYVSVYVGAVDGFNSVGRARSVAYVGAQKISIGNEGRKVTK